MKLSISLLLTLILIISCRSLRHSELKCTDNNNQITIEYFSDLDFFTLQGINKSKPSRSGVKLFSNNGKIIEIQSKISRKMWNNSSSYNKIAQIKYNTDAWIHKWRVIDDSLYKILGRVNKLWEYDCIVRDTFAVSPNKFYYFRFWQDGTSKNTIAERIMSIEKINKDSIVIMRYGRFHINLKNDIDVIPVKYVNINLDDTLRNKFNNPEIISVTQIPNRICHNMGEKANTNNIVQNYYGCYDSSFFWMIIYLNLLNYGEVLK